MLAHSKRSVNRTSLCDHCRETHPCKCDLCFASCALRRGLPNMDRIEDLEGLLIYDEDNEIEVSAHEEVRTSRASQTYHIGELEY